MNDRRFRKQRCQLLLAAGLSIFAASSASTQPPSVPEAPVERPRLLPNLRQAIRQQIQQPAPQPQQPQASPRLEPIAETKLLMEGLALANYRGLGRLLSKEPPDVETWTFARGQALLLAETGNLLMLRPPRTTGQQAWMSHATDLRSAATSLARSLGRRDFASSKAGLSELGNVCTRCHTNFRIAVNVREEEKPNP